MRPFAPKDFLRIFWPHWLGALVFLGLFALQLIHVLPSRPNQPDPAHGFTIEMDYNSEAIYVSTQDLALLYGTLLIGALIVLSGMLRVRMAQRSSADKG
ncbi:MAG: hypothetical protein KDA53_12185 [Hyphomonas sp.]|nr:hypothetical protein [Hyphomonas sp.]